MERRVRATDQNTFCNSHSLLEGKDTKRIGHPVPFFLLLHRACCRVTQLLHQPLHIYRIYKIYTLKH